jgi:hypothetical protein
MLAAVLAWYANPLGILFDQPHVVTDAPPLLEARGVARRVTIEPGDFFKTVPAGGDAYILSHIIHDWSEEQCLAILGHGRKAIKPGGRLLIVEMVLPDGDAPHPGKLSDLVMLAMVGGQERTETEYASLLGKAGFRVQQVVPTASAVSVVEAVPATKNSRALDPTQACTLCGSGNVRTSSREGENSTSLLLPGHLIFRQAACCGTGVQSELPIFLISRKLGSKAAVPDWGAMGMTGAPTTGNSLLSSAAVQRYAPSWT